MDHLPLATVVLSEMFFCEEYHEHLSCARLPQEQFLRHGALHRAEHRRRFGKQNLTPISAGSHNSKISLRMRSGSFSRSRPQARQHFLPVKVYDSSLIALARMDMNPCGTALEQIREYLHMSLWISAHRPTFRHFFEGDLSLGALLNGFRIANIEVGLPCLRTETPEFCRFLKLAFAPNHDILLNKDRHSSRILAGIGGALLKFSLVLLPGLGIGNESVRILPAAPHCLGAIACH